MDILRMLNLDKAEAQDAYPPSTASIKDLTPIYIRDLRPGVCHRGSYLLVRCITEPDRTPAITVMVEDEKEDAIMLQLYYQPDEDIRPASWIIPKGDVFISKEPYLEMIGDGNYVVRIDHVSDLVQIDTWREQFPKRWNPSQQSSGKTAADWKGEGNTAFEKKQYPEAIKHYTTALASSPTPEEETVIRLNRELAYVRDESFEAALVDTQVLQQTPDISEKALYRGSKALYSLGRFSECEKVLRRLQIKYPKNSEAAKEIKKVNIRLREEQSGSYNFTAIFKDLAKVGPLLDRATFVGAVAVKESPGRGSGLFTTKPVKAGELLLCEKAFAYCYPDMAKENSTYLYQTAKDLQITLVKAILQKLLRNPSYAAQLKTLHHGSYRTVNENQIDGKLIIDTFLVQRIIELNGFACSLTTKGLHNKQRRGQDLCKGVWPIASRINHSCISNVRRSFIGDLLILRSTCDIPADTELKSWYNIPTGDYEEMQIGLRHWGFQCDCSMCNDLKSTSEEVKEQRKNLLRNFEESMSTMNRNITNAEQILNAIGKTYQHPKAEIPRLLLREPYARLAEIYMNQGNAQKSVAMALKVLESLGHIIKGAQLSESRNISLRVEKWGVMADDVINMWVVHWNAYNAFKPHLLQQAEDYGKLAYRICMGEDVTFKGSHDPEGGLE